MLLSESSQKLSMSDHPPKVGHSRIHREIVWSPGIEYSRSEVYSSIILPVCVVSSLLSPQELWMAVVPLWLLDFEMMMMMMMMMMRMMIAFAGTGPSA